MAEDREKDEQPGSGEDEQARIIRGRPDAGAEDKDAVAWQGEVGGGVGVTPDGGIIPGAVPAHLPQSPDREQLERDIKGDFPFPPPGQPPRPQGPDQEP